MVGSHAKRRCRNQCRSRTKRPSKGGWSNAILRIVTLNFSAPTNSNPAMSNWKRLPGGVLHRDNILTHCTRREGDCLVWTRATIRGGYGQATVGKKHVLAHRRSYELFVGPVPDKTLVLHSCDNPACINPAHLFLGTPLANMRDMLAKGRGRFPGPRSISGETKALIRAETGQTQAQLAAKYNLTTWAISSVRRNKP